MLVASMENTQAHLALVCHSHYLFSNSTAMANANPQQNNHRANTRLSKLWSPLAYYLYCPRRAQVLGPNCSGAHNPQTDTNPHSITRLSRHHLSWRTTTGCTNIIHERHYFFRRFRREFCHHNRHRKINQRTHTSCYLMVKGSWKRLNGIWGIRLLTNQRKSCVKGRGTVSSAFKLLIHFYSHN